MRSRVRNLKRSKSPKRRRLRGGSDLYRQLISVLREFDSVAERYSDSYLGSMDESHNTLSHYIRGESLDELYWHAPEPAVHLFKKIAKKIKTLLMEGVSENDSRVIRVYQDIVNDGYFFYKE